jgi:type I restriction enzyme S subunit
VTTDNNRVSAYSGKELPSGWMLATIPEFIGSDSVFSDGDWVESKDQDPEGNVRLIQLADIGDGNYRDKSNRFLTKEKAIELKCTFLEVGDVLVARMPDPLGRACIFPGDEKEAVTVVDVCIIRAEESKINHKWLMHFINSPQSRRTIESLQSGTTRKRISRKNLAKIEFPVPPLPEQERIVAKLEETFTQLEAGVAELRNAKAQLKRYRAAVLKSAVEGELTREWREAHQGEIEPAETLLARILDKRRKKWYAEDGKGKYKEPAAPNTDILPELPKGWVWVRFEQIIVEGPQNGLYLPKTAYDSGFPILRIDDYQNNSSRLSSELRMVTAPEDLLEKYKLSLDDLVINRVNSPSHLGKCLKIADRNLPAIFESNMMRLHLSSYVDVSFVEKYLHSHIGKERLIKNAKWAVNQASINQQDVKNTIVPLPPLEEQKVVAAKIERRLSVADEIEKELDGALVRAERLRGSILKNAFEGKL